MIDKGTYKDRVIEFLYDQLRQGELTPGDKVLELALAKRLQISRAPIREALTQMVGDGLFVCRPQVGTFVASLSASEIIDAYVTRGLLEGFSVAAALQDFTSADYQLLQAHCAAMEALADNQEQLALIELGRDFHTFLFHRCGNRQLIEYTQRLSSKLHLLFYKHWASLYTPAELRSRHEKLLAIMQTKDAMQVELVFRAHYLETGQRVAELYAKKQQEKES
ncbi:MAG TPA: GntR family transcriptional regulator [Malonomonas sp.]